MLKAPLPTLTAQGDELNTSIPWSPIFVTIMVLAVAVSLLVAGLLAYALLRTRRRPGEEPPEQEHGNRKLEIGWTAIPAVLVLALFGYTLYVMLSTRTPGAGIPEGRQPDIVVVGHQFWWEYRYPPGTEINPTGEEVVTANELHLPADRELLVELRSFDVQHDFWIPPLGQKMDMYPGKVNHTWLYAEEPGSYRGACAEFCGIQHAWMRILAIAEPQEEFTAWLQDQLAPTTLPDDPLVQQGEEIFAQNACGSCHAIRGTPWDGEAGPQLTDFGNRDIISAGVLENTPENLAKYLANPQAVKPGIFMPNYRFSEDQLVALVAYLESLK